jgi:hypothetical protein
MAYMATERSVMNFWFVRFDKFDEAVSRDNPPARAVGESGDGADRGFGRWRRVTAHA